MRNEEKLTFRSAEYLETDFGTGMHHAQRQKIVRADAPGFALGVQWRAEYDPQQNPINRALFEAFGEALRANISRG